MDVLAMATDGYITSQYLKIPITMSTNGYILLNSIVPPSKIRSGRGPVSKYTLERSNEDEKLIIDHRVLEDEDMMYIISLMANLFRR